MIYKKQLNYLSRLFTGSLLNVFLLVACSSTKPTAKELALIKNPDKIMVIILEEFPELNNQTVNNHFEGARAMGNIILIKPRYKDNSVILCHELVHMHELIVLA